MQAAISPTQIEKLQISVVIPTYNRAHLIGRAIDSALNQTRPPAEIIVVDDGSNDETQERVAAFGSRVQYIHQQNEGAAVARHTGMKATTSDWVALLDSDDYWEPEHLERIAQAIIMTNGRARFYFADAMKHAPDENESTSFWAYRGFMISGEYEFREDATDWVMMPGQPMLLQASVVNRDAYFASGGFWPPLRYRDDTHLYLKLGLGGPACAVSGIGTQMTTDDTPGNRLTLTLGSQQGHFYRIMMINELLTRDIAPRPRRQLRRRLAKAHLRLAYFHARRRGWKTAVSHLWHSLRTDPVFCLQDIMRTIARLLS